MFEEQVEQCEAELELYHAELRALRSDDIPDDEQATEIASLEEAISNLRSHLVALRNALRAASVGTEAPMSSQPASTQTGSTLSSSQPAVAPAASFPETQQGVPPAIDAATSSMSIPETPPQVAASNSSRGLPDDAIRWGDEAHYAAREQLLSHPDFANGRVPREFGMDGLAEIAPHRLQSANETAEAAHQRRAAAALDQGIEIEPRTPLEPAPLPSDVNPNQIDPRGPARGEIGHVAPYDEHRSSQDPSRRADYDASGARISEREHGIPGAQLCETAINPETGESQYQHYNQDPTYWNEREAALNKTHGNRGGADADNPTTRRMQAATRAGEAHDLAEVSIHARENAQRSAAAINSTGQPISSVPGQSIDAAIYHQMSNMSGARTTDQTVEALSSMPDEPTTLNMSKFDEDFMSSFADDAVPSPQMSSMPDDVAHSGVMSLADDSVPQGGGTLRGLGRAAQLTGDGLAVAGVAMSGYQVGSGMNQIMGGDVAQGSVNVAEGSTNIGMEIGTTYAVESGAVVAEGGAAAVGVTVLAGIGASGALAWAFEDTRRALDGRPTMLDEAIEAWSTEGFGLWVQLANELPDLGEALMSDGPPEDEYTTERGLPRSDTSE